MEKPITEMLDRIERVNGTYDAEFAEGDIETLIKAMRGLVFALVNDDWGDVGSLAAFYPGGEKYVDQASLLEAMLIAHVHSK